MENITKEGSLEINLNLPIKHDEPYEKIVKSIHEHKKAIRFAS